MTTAHKVHARNVRTGDIIVLDADYRVRVTFVALVRGLDIEIKYRPANMMLRTATEHRMVLPKHTMLTVEV